MKRVSIAWSQTVVMGVSFSSSEAMEKSGIVHVISSLSSKSLFSSFGNSTWEVQSLEVFPGRLLWVAQPSFWMVPSCHKHWWSLVVKCNSIGVKLKLLLWGWVFLKEET